MSDAPNESREVPVATRRPVIPDYELLRPIGSGSYGDVWLARGVTGIFRAVKVVWRERFADSEPFEREFRGLKEFAAISLKTEGQMALLHIGRNEAAGFFYYVMELADDANSGRTFDPSSYVPLTFKEWKQRRGRVPAGEVIAAGHQLATALAALHARGLVHRDIKPSNAIIVDGRAKLADIGLVAAIDEAKTFIGTSGYVPPEGPGAPAADVYALGRVLYELASGLRHEDFPKLPPDLEKPGAERAAYFDLNEVLLRACAPLARNRYGDAGEMAADLSGLWIGRRRTGSGWKWAAASVVLACAGTFATWSLRPSAPLPSASPIPPAAAPAKGVAATSPTAVSPVRAAGATETAAMQPADEKALVVLPLENLSAGAEDGLFTDGMHAELIATLGRIPGLRVISRNSAQRYRDTKLTMAEIGRELNVANIVTGSVRSAGSKVRINLELRRASDEALLWSSPRVDQEFADVWALQDEMADEVARVLQVRADSGWYVGAKLMTKNERAYQLFLQARELPRVKGPGLAAMHEQAELCEEALRLDPDFMYAAALASSAYAYMLQEPDPAKRQANARQAKHWAERASALMPGGGGDGALAVYYSMVERDPELALRYAENEVRALPNEANAYNRLAGSLSDFGRHEEAKVAYDRAIALDPLNVRVLHNRVNLFATLRRVTEFEEAAAKSLDYGGRNTDYGRILVRRALLTGRLPETFDDGRATVHPDSRVTLLLYRRKFEEAMALAKKEAQTESLALFLRMLMHTNWGIALERLGRTEERRGVGQEMLRILDGAPPALSWEQAERDTDRMWALALVDRGAEARQLGRRLVETTTGPGLVRARLYREAALAEILGWLGDAKEANELLGSLLRRPSGITVYGLELNPIWDAIRGDSGFQALLADPKNREPL